MVEKRRRSESREKGFAVFMIGTGCFVEGVSQGGLESLSSDLWNWVLQYWYVS
jgi:hypothetical protein